LGETGAKLSKNIKENKTQMKAAEEKLKTPEAQAAIEERNKQEIKRLNDLKAVEQVKGGLDIERRELRSIKSDLERIDPAKVITLQGDKNDPKLLVNNKEAINSQIKEFQKTQPHKVGLVI
jgi:hypothetical protein